MADPVKEWSRENPFSRINSPFAKLGLHADGDGFPRGCRRAGNFIPSDSIFDQIKKVRSIKRRLMVAVPGWVGVEAAPNLLDQIKEVQGFLIRSFQTWTDFPLRQWHRWYDWNFHLDPDPDYAYLRGDGNLSSLNELFRPGETPEQKKARELAAFEEAEMDPEAPTPPARGEQLVVRRPGDTDGVGDAMECEWDCGAFGPREGIMFDADYVKHGFWPQASQHFWSLGRWIYDCGHEGGTGLHRTELHPVLAMASTRWEAIAFEKTCKTHWPPEFAGKEIGIQTLPLPAIQFLFFTSRSGGYKNYPNLKNQGRDLEFIVDLPEFNAGGMRWPIGRTADFPLNTGTLRDGKLVAKLDFTPFDRAIAEPVIKDAGKGDPVDDRDAGNREFGFDPCYDFKKPSSRLEPIIEVLPPKKGTVPQQVKVTVPVSQLPATEDAYGFVLSLGFFDAGNVQAKKVRKCTVELDHIFKAPVDHDLLAEEWNVKICVNGRWMLFQDNDVHNNTQLPLDRKFEFSLAEGDPILISAHGSEIDLVGDRYFEDLEDRWLILSSDLIGGSNDAKADWDRHIVGPLGEHNLASRIASDLMLKMATTVNDQNDPLGQIDPSLGTEAERQINPMIVDKPFARKAFVLQALSTREIGASAELAEDRDILDWRLHFFVTVEDPKIP
jgi:hypothetical protein